MRTTIIGVDLATKAIQVCVYLNSKVLSNKELTPQQFSEFLRQQSHVSWYSNLAVALTTGPNIVVRWAIKLSPFLLAWLVL
ncbi:hypothetical protein [Vibrio mediterranei]|uniref:hypothetical protein n=1 Tax=Vibrio mediterranei TaxID=689 RepID=UPI00156BDF17|nr:hypothetical protein [Vibrio mediterranei]